VAEDKNRPAPRQQPVSEIVCSLRVIEVPRVVLVPRVIGYGTAEPGDIWTAVAEVKGRVTKVHPDLKSGAMLRQGEEVLRIDPTEYELQVARLQADIAQVKSQQGELTAREENFRESLKIEVSSFALAERDLKRLQSLRASNSVTQSEIESKEREVLTQRQTVQLLRNSIHILPAQQESLAATLAAKQASLDLAKIDVSRTVINTPFDCRLGELAIEKGQFVTAGQALFKTYGTQVTEVEAQFPIDQVRTLLTSDGQPVDLSTNAMETMRKVFDVEAVVRLRTGDFVVEWTGRFDRIREQLDIQTRTVRLVIAVDKPYENVIPGQRPPLAPGMFCEVELHGKPRTGQMVIPRMALQEGHVYLVNQENRLVRRAVDVAFSQGGFSCIRGGLSPGERLVISDPTPAIEGMLVEPVLDDEAVKALVTDATGEGSVR